MTNAGDWITDPLAMSVHAVSHFQSVLGPSTYCLPQLFSPTSWFTETCAYRCPDQIAHKMIELPTPEEIKRTIFKLNQNKAPGPDGLTSGFFKALWSVSGDKVVKSISHFFTSAFLPTSLNATILSLVPKFPGATKISQFRPISCLNTVYKAISRMLVKRLKLCLPDLILPSQTAFVKNRLLLENTILASELINGYHKNKGPKKITIKVDIAKAFDTLSWEFLFAALHALDLPH